MKKSYWLLIAVLLSLKGLALDTLYYPNGKIHHIYSRNNYWKEYYMNGSLKMLRIQDGYFTRGKERNYDSTDVLISKGHIVFGHIKTGRWLFYDNGNKSIKHYKYGLEKKELRSPGGKRLDCLLTYGYFSSRGYSCDSAAEKYKVMDVPIAGCSVTSKLLFKAGIHNFFILSRLIIRHGADWEEDRRNMCRKVRGLY